MIKAQGVVQITFPVIEFRWWYGYTPDGVSRHDMMKCKVANEVFVSLVVQPVDDGRCGTRSVGLSRMLAPEKGKVRSLVKNKGSRRRKST